jgi:leucyl aminopeptidase (aminopeptidase T)
MAVANRLVTGSLGVSPGEYVLVAGTPADAELLENIAVEVRKAGAWPFITVASDRLTKMSFDAVPAARDVDRPTLDLAIAKLFTSMIVVEGAISPGNLRDVPAERLAARAKAAESINNEIVKLNRKVVFLGNGMFPSEENARLNGMAPADFAQLFWKGVNVDAAAMAATGNAVRSSLRSGKTVRITDARGTDLTLSLAGLDPYFSDGQISDEDKKRGPQAQTIWLPAGEVYVRVQPGSATGTVVTDYVMWEGQPVEAFKVELKDGRVTAMTATSGLDRLKTRYDAESTGKDLLSILDVGVNKAMSVPAGSRFQTYVTGGTITLFLGSDTWAGGTNTTAFGLPLFLNRATLAIDGTTLVKDGVLQQ